MSWKNVDFDNLFRRIAEKRIEDAMAEGKFDNLPGMGQPLDLEPLPADENARMLWWTLRIMRQHDFMPNEVSFRKALDGLKSELAATTDERRMAVLVQQINALVYKINTMGTGVSMPPVTCVSLDEERAASAGGWPGEMRYVMVEAPAQPESHVLAAEVKHRARALGFDLVGITDAQPSRYREYLRTWLDDGQAGSMEYLKHRFDERTDPAAYLPGAKSVVCVALNYHVPLDPVADEARDHRGKVARYALGTDYHELIKHRLWELADWIRATVPGAETKTSVDTAPVMEKELAARAGVGWIGKNTCLINADIGSWVLLGEVITTVDLPFDSPGVDRCGTCQRCIDACPTGAITGPYQLDARRCISYLTIEHGGEVPADHHAGIGEWVYGCDICQDVCPWNSKAAVTADPALQPRFPTGTIDLAQLLAWRQPHYPPQFSRSAMKRVKLPVLQRNARIVAQNLSERR